MGEAGVSTGDASPDPGKDLMPDFVVTRVLHLIPVKQVFRLMRVNKLWKRTAESVIRTKRRLQLGVMMNEAETFVSPLDTMDCLFRPELEARMWSSLLTMKQLSVLICGDLFPFSHTSPLDASSDSSDQGSGLQRLVVQNRRSLEVVILDPGTDFPVPRDEERVSRRWPVLRTLHCRQIYTAIVDSCPALERVNCFRVTSLLSLDCIKITRLTHLELGCVSGFSIKEFVDVVTQFRKLELLILYFQFKPTSDHSALNHLFCNTTRLTHVHLSVPMDTSMDRAVRQLIIRNPGLRILVLTSMHLTDTSLKWIARAEELTLVDIRSPRAQFSADGVISLLRGPSRLLLTEVIIHCEQQLDQHLLHDEVHAMQQEEGHAPELTVLKFDPLMDESSDDEMQFECSAPA